jgi:ABC-type arginine transport system ATPase subunit
MVPSTRQNAAIEGLRIDTRSDRFVLSCHGLEKQRMLTSRAIAADVDA